MHRAFDPLRSKIARALHILPTSASGKRSHRDSQFTCPAFTGVLTANGIAISIDGKRFDATTCSSSGCGTASNTSMFISEPTTALAKRAPRSDGISVATTAAVRIRAFTAPSSMRPTSEINCCRPARLATPAEIPPIKAEILFRYAGPALLSPVSLQFDAPILENARPHFAFSGSEIF